MSNYSELKYKRKLWKGVFFFGIAACLGWVLLAMKMIFTDENSYSDEQKLEVLIQCQQKLKKREDFILKLEEALKQSVVKKKDNILMKETITSSVRKHTIFSDEEKTTTFSVREKFPIFAVRENITIFAVTPTYSRSVQKAELTRISQTFLHIPNFHWIVVEDSSIKSNLVANFLKECNLNYTHLNVKTPDFYKMKPSDPNWLKPRGVLQRNLALTWLRKNINIKREKGVLYFADDDNTYSLKLFQEMRNTKIVSVWPVGLVGGLRYEKPLVTEGKVVGWFTHWASNRPFAMDMAGFAINLERIFRFKEALFTYKVPRGYQESALLKNLGVTLADLEPKADLCTKILVWHTQTVKPKLKNEIEMKKRFGHGTDLNIEL